MIIGPLVRVPRHPLVLVRFGLPALTRHRRGRPHLVPPTRRPRSSPAAAHSFLPLTPRARRRRRPCSSPPGTRRAGRWPRADRRPSPMPWPTSSPSSGLDQHRRSGPLARRLPQARAVLFDVTPRQVLRDRRGTAARPLPRPPERSSATGRGRSRWTTRSPSPVPWTNADGRRAGSSTSEARRGRSRRPRPTWLPVATHRGPSCSSPSRACSTRPGARGPAHALGLLPLPRPARPST